MRLIAVTLMLLATIAAASQDHEELQVQRWRSATIPTHRLHEVGVICDRIIANKDRYDVVEIRTGVPYHVVAALHNMESGGSFTSHLHEGSSLKFRTRYIPKGRPKTGTPPFTWEYSAVDAMNYDAMGDKDWKHLGSALSACEGYNGWGYAKYHPNTPTPYLWAVTTVERPGKYTGDGVWSPTARSSQVGVAAIWKELERRRLAAIPPP